MLRDPAFEHELAQQIERSPRFFQNAPVVLDLKGADGFHRRRRIRRRAEDKLRALDADPGRRAERRSRHSSRPPPRPGWRALPRRASSAAGARRRAARRAPRRAAPARRAARHRAGALRHADLRPRQPISSSPPRSAPAPSWSPTAISMFTARCAAARWPGRAATPTRESSARRLEAELVSIAGRYLVSEQLPAEQQGSPVQIALVDDQLTITRN